MKLKKLILQGFKSFADRTEFDFHEGITVIVGPNGCGKSNVVDAVKWVLGEQRPTSLRGKEMQDVIFSGTDSRRGLGYAEVSLVLDNGSQTLPLDYEEVSLTRRLYRSGESEYLINGNTVRLRDIRELMMDSGGGPGGLTVMEQGNIDRLLRADPQERRMVFEEAAGIAKYRARRQEAQRKLERTGDNLARLRDIISEYETRQRSLKIQAGKARRYREMSEELKRKRLAGALARYADLRRRRDAAMETLAEIERSESDARTGVEEAVRGSAGQRQQLDDQRQRVADGEAEMAALMGERRADEEKRSARERESQTLAERAQGADQEAAEALRSSERLAGEISGARERAAGAQVERARRAEALAAAEALLREVEGRTDVMRTEREELDRMRTAAFAEETTVRNNELTIGAECKALRARIERLETREHSAREELGLLESARHERRAIVARAEARVGDLERRHAEAEEGARESRKLTDERTGELGRHAGDTQALEARLDVLAALVESGEGLGAGTRALLDAAQAGELSGIRGTLAGLVGNAGPHARLLDQALGDLAGAVVAETTEDALAAIEWLERKQRGRARLIPLDRIDEAPLPPGLTELSTDAAPLLGALLAGTRIAPSLREALEAEGALRVIVPSGEVFEPPACLEGGTGEGGAGLVVRHAELAEVSRSLDRALAAREHAQVQLEEARAVIAGCEQTLESLRPELRLAREERRTAGEALAAAEKAAVARAEELDLEEAERSDVEVQLVRRAEELEAAGREREQAEARRADLEEEALSLQERLARAARAREESLTRHTETRVEAARWTEKAEAAEQRIAGLEASIASTRQQARVRTEEAASCRTRRAACLDEIEVLDRLAREREAGLAGLAKEVERRREAVRASRERLEQTEGRIDELRRLHEERREELERHRLTDSELRLRLETLLDQVRTDHGLDLAAVPLEEADEEADPEALEAEMAELRSKLERLGNVNHAALEELAGVEERLAFMQREEADLVSAERQLRETIVRIDEVSTERFTDTFEKVRANFHLVFRKLFGGGKAEIFLEDPEDPLNTGVEIRVRPPGKELRNMALLSGGEKSLTTVALLFSIYQTKPPPFCLLDEVDAALDETNTMRMCEMLKEFSERGQFLVITHARPTMTVADTLYGVTMPEAGVSRQVSVRFQDIEAGRVVGLN